MWLFFANVLGKRCGVHCANIAYLETISPREGAVTLRIPEGRKIMVTPETLQTLENQLAAFDRNHSNF